ncbi:MAG: hypothetical protein PHP42_06580, partial [Bacteroidota bacterium]|nr:hypothetical protein [Bacteroidota bacterium]
IIYKTNGSIEKKILDIYDDQGFLLETVGYLNDARVFMRNSYLYDINGNVQELKNNLNKFTYTYDSRNNLASITKSARYFQKTDTVRYVVSDYFIFEYNADDNLIGMSHLKPDSTLKVRFQYLLDHNGVLLEEKEFDGDNKMAYQRMLTYDKNGNLITEQGLDRGRKFKTTYRYDSKGNKTEAMVFDQIDEPSQLVKYLYAKYSAGKEQPSRLPEDVCVTDTVDTTGIDEYYDLLGCRIIASDGVYLGMVIADTTNPESIINTWGQYGFEKSPTSIFNPTVQYGGAEGIFSPFNDNCPSPPSIYKDGKFFTYLSTNDNFRPRSSPQKLITFLRRLPHKHK